jgi:hypothetical protein
MNDEITVPGQIAEYVGRCYEREPGKLNDGTSAYQFCISNAYGTWLAKIPLENGYKAETVVSGEVHRCRVANILGNPILLEMSRPAAPKWNAWGFLPQVLCPESAVLEGFARDLLSMKNEHLGEFLGAIFWERQMAEGFVRAPVPDCYGLDRPGGLLVATAQTLRHILADTAIPLPQREVGAVAGVLHRFAGAWRQGESFEMESLYDDGGCHVIEVPFPEVAYRTLSATRPRMAGGLERLWQFLDDPVLGEEERRYRVFETLLSAVKAEGAIGAPG